LFSNKRAVDLCWSPIPIVSTFFIFFKILFLGGTASLSTVGSTREKNLNTNSILCVCAADLFYFKFNRRKSI
jgi:hypothetical protein